MDALDSKILRALIRDGRLQNSDLARAVGLSESATFQRVRRMKREGVIRGFAALVEPARVGRGLEVFMAFTLRNQSPRDRERFERAMRRMDEVLICAQVLGRFDYFAHVAVADSAALERFINRRLLGLGCVARIESFAALHVSKRFHSPLPSPEVLR